LIKHTGLINAWLEYIKLEEVVNLKISDKIVHHDAYYNDLNIENSMIESHNTQLLIKFHNIDYVKYTIQQAVENSQKIIDYIDEKYGFKPKNNKLHEYKVEDFIEDDALDKEETFYCLFPIIREKISNNDFCYYPLFVLTFSAKIKDITIPLLKTEENNNPYTFCFDTATLTDFIICKPVFINILKIDIDEFDELDTQKPLLTFIVTEFLKEKEKENFDFATAFSMLKDYCETTLKKYYPSGNFKLWDKDFIIIPGGKIDIIESVKIKRQLNILKGEEFDPEKFRDSAIYKYLYEEQQISFEDYNKPDDTIWYGTYHPFGLSDGQGILLQKFAKGENLIAVQGPPGTGKTTILMSIIANTLTERAINIAKGEADYPTLILVASTANKAVENAAREFIDADKNPQLKDLPLYANNGFYFIGGKKDNISSSLKKVSDFIAHLEEFEWVSQIEEKYQNLKNKILECYQELINTLNTLKELKNKYNYLKAEMKKEIKKIQSSDHNTSDINKTIDETTEKIIKFEEKYRIFIQNNPNLFTDIMNQYTTWKEQLQNAGLNESKFIELKNSQQFSSLCEDFLKLCSSLRNQTLIEKILFLFTRKEKTLIESFVLKHRKLLEMLNFKPTELLNCGAFKNSIPEIEKLISFVDKPLPYDFFISEEDMEILKNYHLFLELIQIKKQLSKIEQDELFKWVSDKDGIFNFWKSKYESTRNLFLLASEFLYLHALKNRDTVIKNLKRFIKIYNGDNYYKTIQEIKQDGLSNFFRDVSLIYPVHFSSLHSSPYIYEHFTFSLDKSFKPIYLLFIDESAMALPHLAYPSIFWSEKVIAVGDPLQLQPVVPLSKELLYSYHKKCFPVGQTNKEMCNCEFDTVAIAMYSPAETSVYHRVARCSKGDPEISNIGQACFLDYHRRCQRPIAELFSMVTGYKKLNIATPPLKKSEQEKLSRMGDKNIIFCNVEEAVKANNAKNTNLKEIQAVEKILKKLELAGYNLKEEVGIITPYVKQEQELQKKFKSKIPYYHIGTVHKFQGSELSVIIMSTVVHFKTHTSLDFIDKHPNMLNVAISRAKHLFIMVGNAKTLEKTKHYLKVLKNNRIISDNDLNDFPASMTQQ